jgi:hypothetical protein
MSDMFDPFADLTRAAFVGNSSIVSDFVVGVFDG